MSAFQEEPGSQQRLVQSLTSPFFGIGIVERVCHRRAAVEVQGAGATAGGALLRNQRWSRSAKQGNVKDPLGGLGCDSPAFQKSFSTAATQLLNSIDQTLTILDEANRSG